ncbi:MAG: hypothetical protein O3A65_02920 [Proteobacteria bacterium]|nr:hypothetical protein [Pseudomonadota bacterium]
MLRATLKKSQGVKFCFIWLGLMCAVDAQADYHYRVSAELDLKKLTVDLCFKGQPPEKLVAESLDASVALIGAWYESGEPITLSGFIPTAGLSEGTCIHYQVDISRGVQRHDMTGPKLYKSIDATAVSNGLWFWRPEIIANDRQVFVEFKLPFGYSLSTPWNLTGSEGVLEVPATPFDWPSWIVLGRFFKKELILNGTRFDISILDGSPKPDAEELAGWIDQEAAYIQSALGEIPFPNVQVFIIPNARAREPVPVAYVTRGGSPTLHLMINQRRHMQEFYDDWTVTHELSHLFLPFVSPGDAWFYEGFASYYQYVVRARKGLLSPQKAWSNLIYGFRRGSREAEARGLTLLEATQKMYQGEPFMQVYWGGAAMMLIADVQLRKESSGAWSLDRVIREFNLCCMDRTRAWTAFEVLSIFDDLYGYPLFVPLMNRYVGTNEFPDLADAFQLLGLVVSDGDVTLSDEVDQRSLRDQIMLISKP